MQTSIVDKPFRRNGFTVVEVVIGMLLLTLVVSAVGLAMGHFAQRTGDARLAVSDLQQQQRLVQIITDDLSRLKSITSSTTTQLIFAIDDSTGGKKTVTYIWSGADIGTFTRQLNGDAPAVLSDEVADFELEYQTNEQNDEEWVCGFLLKLTWKGESEEILVHIVELTNPILIDELPVMVTLTGGITEDVEKTLKTAGTYLKTKF